MPSHSEPEFIDPRPDCGESPACSGKQPANPIDETLADVTHRGPNAADSTEVELDKTLEKTLQQVFVELSQTLPAEQQNLDQTLPEVSLKPATGMMGSGKFGRPFLMQAETLSYRKLLESVESTGDAGQVDAAQDYVKLGKLGEGGMGAVHLARQVALERDVALKQIHRRSSYRQLVRDEFLAEAVLTGKLEHPNIIPIYEVGQSESGDLFYAMKNVKGRAWEETIDDLAVNQNLRILIDVCDALAFAHAEGVIHRDLKPRNIMTGGFGEVLVLDWGLALLVPRGQDVKASAGGTPGYMAPEMVNPPFLVGIRSDVYLLGAILFRILAGRPPHAGQSARASLEAASKNRIGTPDAERMQTQDPTGQLLEVALQAMSTDPGDRFQTVSEFQQAVSDFEAHQESLQLASRAEETLAAAEQNGDYAQYSEAVFGFTQAATLWEGNSAAVQGVERARQLYALRAEQKEDYALALSLLNKSIYGQPDVIQRLTSARNERDARLGRLRRLKQGLAVSAMLIIVIVTGAAFSINQARLDADREADKARKIAYTSDMRLAKQDWDDASIGRFKDLLERHRGDSYRGFEWLYLDRLLNSHLRTLTGHTHVIFVASGTVRMGNALLRRVLTRL